MSDPVLHIKDSYYFEIPKFMLRRHYTDKDQFPEVWVKNDEQFQEWEAERVYHGLKDMAGSKVELPDEHDLIHHWEHWQHAGANHENFGKPFDLYLESLRDKLVADFNQKNPEVAKDEHAAKWNSYIDEAETAHTEGVWFAKLVPPGDKVATAKWDEIKAHAGSYKAVHEFQADKAIKWDGQKLASYNEHLSGKILIPQPFAELRNMYEKESGVFAISKFMIIEVVIALGMFVLFTWVAGRLSSGGTPKGRSWNLFEVFLVFIRDQIARPAIGGGHHEEAHADEGHVDTHGTAPVHDTGGELPGIPDHIPQGHGYHDEVKHGNHHNESDHHGNEADKFVPLLWTIFFFVLGCNLCGMLPWVGAPTASWSTTLSLAGITFATVWVMGMYKFGFVGFFLNQIPGMDLPWYMAIFLKPMIFAIEMLGLFIKHLVLSIRLLANMVAGHLVILGVMGLAFGAEAAISFSAPDVPAWQWPLVATIAVIGSTLFNVLELFVAFLRAYVFTFLSALFIGAAVHKH